MMLANVFLVAFVFVCSHLHSVSGNTDRLRILTCDGNNRRIVAAHITSGNVRGKLECYYEPKAGDYMFRIRINKLDLQKRGSVCPSVKFIGFTTKHKLPEEDDDWREPDKGILVPADPQTLKFFDCNNYKSAQGVIFETRNVGQKVLFVYDTKNVNVDVLGNVDFTITSYVSGPSYQCPAKHFRCWETRHVCIDESVECDEIDNCYDNSDEDNFKCSGKILGMVLPIFVIMILLILLLLIGVIIATILYCRRRNRKIAKERENQDAATMRRQQVMPYYLPSRPFNYTQPPPEITSGQRKSWQQMQVEQQHKNAAFDNSAEC